MSAFAGSAVVDARMIGDHAERVVMACALMPTRGPYAARRL